MKKISPNWFLRFKAGLIPGIKAGGIMVTAVSTIVGIVSASGTYIPLDIILICGGGCTFVYILVSALVLGQVSHIPDIFIDEGNTEGPYTFEICSGKRLEEACALTKPYYHTEYVPPDVAEQWRMKNPKAFVNILNSKGVLCATFGILALKSSFMDQFVDGKVSDTQLKGEDVLTFAESKKVNRLYISGVVVRDPMHLIGGKRAKVMIWVMLQYVKKFYHLNTQREMYAVAVNKQSDHILQSCRFVLISDKKHRRDQCNLYRYNLTKASWEELLKIIGDHSSMCTGNF